MHSAWQPALQSSLSQQALTTAQVARQEVRPAQVGLASLSGQCVRKAPAVMQLDRLMPMCYEEVWCYMHLTAVQGNLEAHPVPSLRLSVFLMQCILLCLGQGMFGLLNIFFSLGKLALEPETT